ncbi:hypothetical protein HOY82DRAFT_285272 [Tuber indicum]|nr:hypothetical protein HOY82DRAFT_285272 [Tuber indicum]
MSRNGTNIKKRKREAISDSEDSNMGIQKANFTTDATKGRNRKWDTSYSKMTIPDAEKRLGLRLNLRGTSLDRILDGKSGLLGSDSILKVKMKIYQNLVDYIEAGGYPTEADADFKEANINDIVAATIYPIIAQFKRETKRGLHVSREKEIIGTSEDPRTSGLEDFVLMDYISYDQAKYVLVVEAKRASLGEAIKQSFLSLRDMRDCNGGGMVYGFVTNGEHWKMISFGGEFKISQTISLLFETMDENVEQWIAQYSILIECFNVALSEGGKDPVQV